ncbi:lantibiotic dehydratase [Actinokineospora fastidiosa]|uniref:Lantibiotic dehydratase n=1 Tax=Actinokineospora fastidiosa TaxID=1816 RepID=A0A918G2K3_9PSEU|nr:lantibiotic dehydratase [Actinokineospora fastidiosa]GGS13259.1 lantibiotic dehydratase [Actinokineospora fastidiosa]
MTARDGEVPRHLVGLGDTGWLVWRDGLLRSAGFPAAGLDRFADPDLAPVADAAIAGTVADDVFAKAFADAVERAAAAATETAADPLLREAVTWQNPSVLVSLDGLAAGGARRNVRRRDREKALLRYWQRYCGKSETIGFFGPVSWLRVEDDAPALRAEPGERALRGRRVFFEAWAMAALAERLAGDAGVRRWWPVRPRPHVSVEGQRVVVPLMPATTLSTVEAAVLALCDGRPAREVADAGLLRTPEDTYLLLERFVEKGVLHWDAGLPLSPRAEDVLAERIAAIGDAEARARAAEPFARLRAARDRVADADADGLAEALRLLDAEFVAVTGVEPRRRSGMAYAGRTLVYEDTLRDVDVVVGAALLDRVAGPLDVVLRAARWLTAELGAAIGAAVRELYAEQPRPVRLSDLWTMSQGLLFTGDDQPADRVAAEFTRRWAVLFGLGAEGPVAVDTADALARAAELFPATAPGWPSARVHSPDIQVGAVDVDAVNRGECQFVLGELHPASTPVDSALFSVWHPDPAALRAGLDADLGPARLRVLYPADFPRQTGRTRHGLDGPLDRELGIGDTEGADLARTVPATACLVEDVAGELVVRLPDGSAWPLLEAFHDLLSAKLMDSFKLLAPAAHTPRISIGELVVARETWRTTVAETGLTSVTGEPERYLALRRLKARLGLPERVFVKIGTETKPCYLDLTGPLHAQVFASMLRTAQAEGGPDVTVVFTELLPVLEQSWLTDAEGRGYVSELRLQITDPVPYPGGAV